jgi:DNA mismatch repair protein MutL
LGGRDPWPPLLEMLGAAQGRLEALEGAGMLEALHTMANSWFYSLACRAAIKAGDKMTPEAMARLIADMSATPNGAYCPHGRPAIWLIDRFNIEKRFDRR